MADKTSALIGKLRLQRGWSQEQLATASGLSVRTVQRLEAGAPASTESLKALASVFEIDFARLKEPDMTPSPTVDLRHEEALALAHVRCVRALYRHTIAWAVIGVLLLVIDGATGGGIDWSLWVVGVWGAILGLRAWQVFGPPVFGAEWERRQVERRLGRPL